MICYTALGDSITFGEDLPSPDKAYPNLLVAMLRSASKKAVGRIVARSGWTSANLLRALTHLDPITIKLSTAVSIWIGGDNLVDAGIGILQGGSANIIQSTLARYQRDLSMMIQMIQKTSEAEIIVCTQYNPFPNSPLAEKAINALNDLTQQTAASHKIVLAPAHRWFKGREANLIAGYRSGQMEDVLNGRVPVHPNLRGSQVIAHGLFPYVINKS